MADAAPRRTAERSESYSRGTAHLGRLLRVSHKPFRGDGRYDPIKHLALHGLAERQKYVGFLRSTIENIFKAQKWNTTAMLNKLSEAGALYKTEKDRHTKKVTVDKVNHRMICVKWTTILPEDMPHQN